MNPPYCPYCHKPAINVGGDIVYPHRPDLFGKRFWTCESCGAYCGCHPGTDKPLGALANKATRRARMEAHEAFDAIWKSGAMKRKEAYAWLQARMYEGHPIHIGESNEEMCRRIIAIIKDLNGQYPKKGWNVGFAMRVGTIVQESRITPPAKGEKETS